MDLLPTQDWGLLPNGDLFHSAFSASESLLTRGIHLAFRKVKAHSSRLYATATLPSRIGQTDSLNEVCVFLMVTLPVPNSHSQDVLDMEYARRRAFNT